MNYDQARKIQNIETEQITGWRWTSMQGTQISAAVPCLTYKPLDLDIGFTQEKIVGDMLTYWLCVPHETKEEAEKHFYNYSLSMVKEIQLNSWIDCVICHVPTNISLGNTELNLFFHPIGVCKEHNSLYILTKVYPISSDLLVIHA